MDHRQRLLNGTQSRVVVPAKARRVQLNPDGGRRCRSTRSPRQSPYPLPYLYPAPYPYAYPYPYSCTNQSTDGLSYPLWKLTKFEQLQHATFTTPHAYALHMLTKSIEGEPLPGAGTFDLKRLFDGINYDQNGLGNDANPVDNPYNYDFDMPPKMDCADTVDDPNTESKPSAGKLQELSELLRETLCKLYNYIELQEKSEQPAQFDSFTDLSPEPFPRIPAGQQRKPLRKQGRQRVKREVQMVPVQPLIIASPAQQQKAPPAKMRMRLRRRRATRARTSTSPTGTKATKQSKFHTAPMKCDCGTSMWCPRACCKEFGGVIPEQNQECNRNLVMESRDLLEFRSTLDTFKLKAGCDQAADELRLHSMDDNPVVELCCCDAGEDEEEEEEEEQQQQFQQALRVQRPDEEPWPEFEPMPEPESESELEASWEQCDIKEEERVDYVQHQTTYSHKRLQVNLSVDSVCNQSSCSLSSKHFITTVDKSVCTKDMQRELETAWQPPRIVRIYKASAMKNKRHRAMSKSRVKFEQSEISSRQHGPVRRLSLRREAGGSLIKEDPVPS